MRILLSFLISFVVALAILAAAQAQTPANSYGQIWAATYNQGTKKAGQPFKITKIGCVERYTSTKEPYLACSVKVLNKKTHKIACAAIAISYQDGSILAGKKISCNSKPNKDIR